jgi:hypothetical protein
VEDTLKKLSKGQKSQMDSDTLTKGRLSRYLMLLVRGNNILLGTQMITKGFIFPVTLGIRIADISLLVRFRPANGLFVDNSSCWAAGRGVTKGGIVSDFYRHGSGDPVCEES